MSFSFEIVKSLSYDRTETAIHIAHTGNLRFAYPYQANTMHYLLANYAKQDTYWIASKGEIL